MGSPSQNVVTHTYVISAVKPTGAIMGAGLGHDVALLTDGRFSGGSHVSGLL